MLKPNNNIINKAFFDCIMMSRDVSAQHLIAHTIGDTVISVNFSFPSELLNKTDNIAKVKPLFCVHYCRDIYKSLGRKSETDFVDI